MPANEWTERTRKMGGVREKVSFRVVKSEKAYANWHTVAPSSLPGRRPDAVMYVEPMVLIFSMPLNLGFSSSCNFAENIGRQTVNVNIIFPIETLVGLIATSQIGLNLETQKYCYNCPHVYR